MFGLRDEGIKAMRKLKKIKAEPASSANSDLLNATQQACLLQALRFYAEQAAYSPSWEADNVFHAMEDKGRVARNALEVMGI